jgi:hypothetical protein
VLATLEDLRERGGVVHVGGGWRLSDGHDPATSTRFVWLVLSRGAAVLSVHGTEEGARSRVAELDNFSAHVERRRVED